MLPLELIDNLPAPDHADAASLRCNMVGRPSGAGHLHRPDQARRAGGLSTCWGPSCRVIQAFVFTLLSLVYVSLAVGGHDEHEEEHGTRTRCTDRQAFHRGYARPRSGEEDRGGVAGSGPSNPTKGGQERCASNSRHWRRVARRLSRRTGHGAGRRKARRRSSKGWIALGAGLAIGIAAVGAGARPGARRRGGHGVDRPQPERGRPHPDAR